MYKYPKHRCVFLGSRKNTQECHMGYLFQRNEHEIKRACKCWYNKECKSTWKWNLLGANLKDETCSINK